MFSSSKSGSSWESVSWVFYFWQNLSGIRQGKFIDKDRYALPDSEQIAKCPIVNLYMPASVDETPKGLTYANITKDIRVIPDKSTYLNVNWDSYMGFVFTQLMNNDGTPFHGCPRYLLQSAIERLKKYGYELKVGIEVEFILLDKEKMTPINNSTYGHLTSSLKVLGDLNNAAQQLKGESKICPVEKIYKEQAPGQYEMVLSLNEPMKAIDNYHLLREHINNCTKYNYKVCYLPKISQDIGSGLHLHLSLWKNNKNVLGDIKGNYGLSQAGESFMAGILTHYNALLHFLAPSPNSLKRIIPSKGVGAFKFWGIENREAPIRLIEPLTKEHLVSNFEIKSMDHTANQYIGLVAIIVAGIEGLKRKLKLPQPYDSDPSQLSEIERNQLNIGELPKTFDERRDAIFSQEGEPFRQFFGDEFINNLISMQTEDFEFLHDKSLEEEVKILMQRY